MNIYCIFIWTYHKAKACCHCARSLIFTASADVVIVSTFYELATPACCVLSGWIGGAVLLVLC